MKSEIVERVVKEANYIIENKSTVRDTAKVFEVGKSTVHQDVRIKLYSIDKTLFEQVAKILEVNMQERHLRGGESTRLKYMSEKSAR